MSDADLEQRSGSASSSVEPGGQDPAKSRSRRGGSRRGGKPGHDPTDGGRSNRSRIDRGMSGYGDEVERAMCTVVTSVPPRAFPVQHRTGVAVRKIRIVAQTASAVLLCDGAHDGPHVWPNGDIAGDDSNSRARLDDGAIGQAE